MLTGQDYRGDPEGAATQHGVRLTAAAVTPLRSTQRLWSRGPRPKVMQTLCGCRAAAIWIWEPES